MASDNNQENVEVRASEIPGAGRGLFAKKDFAPGDLVVYLDRPLVAELDLDRLRDTCAWCLQRAATNPMERMQAASMGLPNGLIEVKACTGCRRVVYCSKACQIKAWKREHKYECQIIAPQQRPDLPHQVRGTIKLLARLDGDPAVRDTIRDIPKFTPWAHPGSRLAMQTSNPQRYKDFDMLGNAACQYYDRLRPERLETAQGLTFNWNSNAFDLTSPLDSGVLGYGFDPLICAANHSCDPNTVSMFNQPGQLLRALRPIKKGEEITLRYTEVTNPYGVRRADLQTRYHFDCQCSKCSKGPVTPDDTFAKPAEDLSEDFCKRADELIQRHADDLADHLPPGADSLAQRRLAAMQAEAFAVASKDASEKEIKDAIEMCIDSGMWTWARQPVPELCRQLFAQYVETANIMKAWILGSKMLFDTDHHEGTPPFLPGRLINVWTLSTLTNVLCGPAFRNVEEEMSKQGVELRIVYFGFLLDVYDNLPKSYGMSSPLGKVIQNTYAQLMDNVNLTEAEIRTRIDEVWPAFRAMVDKTDVLNFSGSSSSCVVM
ncbi:hypothetical protein F4778DRAFT_786810 [Xylariomycetidae sp. FL2044]|nr:hypothetical protein F4778DRAFT_786810 [Xylariomycetidae sp. FL2044]